MSILYKFKHHLLKSFLVRFFRFARQELIMSCNVFVRKNVYIPVKMRFSLYTKGEIRHILCNWVIIFKIIYNILSTGCSGCSESVVGVFHGWLLEVRLLEELEEAAESVLATRQEVVDLDRRDNNFSLKVTFISTPLSRPPIIIMFNIYTQLFFFSLTHIFCRHLHTAYLCLSNFTTISLGFSYTFPLF